MTFDIPKQLLKCSYCDTESEIEDYSEKNEAEAQYDTYKVTVYTCPNCGAELTAPDDQTVAYCSYCGSESALTMKETDEIRPKEIIPFKVTKERAVKRYERELKRSLYVPKELKDSKHLKSFRGIYIPFLKYEVGIPHKTLLLTGDKEYTKGKYDYHEVYAIGAEIGGKVEGISFDASSAFDDSIAREIAPFNSADEVGFREEYIAGFYSDRLTTSAETYGTVVESVAVDKIYKGIEHRAGNVDIDKPGTLQQMKEETGVDGYDYKVSLLPVWFLTWKNKNRVAYSVMNGQTGKLSMDLPVDMKAFFMISFVASIAIFAVLSLMPMFILPKTISWVSAIFMVISSILLTSEIRKIYFRENHIFDLGSKDNEEKKTKTDKRKKNITIFILSKVLKRIGIVVALYITAVSVFDIIHSLARLDIFLNPFIYSLCIVIQTICSVKTFISALEIEKKTAVIPALFAPAALAIGLIIGIKNPAADYWFYGMALMCFGGMFLNSLSLVNHFNYLTTRPVPDFFRREGADHGI